MTMLGSVSIGWRLIDNIGFADDFLANAEEEDTDILVDRLVTTIKRYTMKIGPDKSNEMTNNQMVSREKSR